MRLTSRRFTSAVAILACLFGCATGLGLQERMRHHNSTSSFLSGIVQTYQAAPWVWFRDGKLLYAKGFGPPSSTSERRTRRRPFLKWARPPSLFRVACIALLLDRKQISIDDDVRKYVPELQEHDPPIRIRDLIRCRSGMWDQWHLVQLVGWSSEPIQAPYSEADLLAFAFRPEDAAVSIRNKIPVQQLGLFSARAYRESRNRQNARRICARNLFEPLGMSRTYFEQDPTTIVKNRAVGYDRVTFRARLDLAKPDLPAAGPVVQLKDLRRRSGAIGTRTLLPNRLGGGRYFKSILNDGDAAGEP